MDKTTAIRKSVCIYLRGGRINDIRPEHDYSLVVTDVAGRQWHCSHLNELADAEAARLRNVLATGSPHIKANVVVFEYSADVPMRNWLGMQPELE